LERALCQASRLFLMGHLSVILALSDAGCAAPRSTAGEIVAIRALPAAAGPAEKPGRRKRADKPVRPTQHTNAGGTAGSARQRKRKGSNKTAAAKRRSAKGRRARLIRSLKSFQVQSPVALRRGARKMLPAVRLGLWHRLLDDCGRWASLARGTKDGKLATRLALWMEDQLALEIRRYKLPAELHLRISEQIRFAKSRAGKNQSVVIIIRHFSPRWPVQDIVVSSFYGTRKDPISGKKKSHKGIDFATPVDTPVKAVADGTVTQSERRGSFGELVVIRHRGGWESRYAHLNTRQVKQGEKVQAGQLIAKSGNSGRSTGPHLHLELRKSGKAIDPLSLSGWH
jgi:murein DD-endopeptidase MepM/ murein hydrolase activator NlpD